MVNWRDDKRFVSLRDEAYDRLKNRPIGQSVSYRTLDAIKDASSPSRLAMEINSAIVTYKIAGEKLQDLNAIVRFLKNMRG